MPKTYAYNLADAIIHHNDFGHIGRWTKDAPVSRPVPLTGTSGFKFSVHTAVQRARHMTLETIAPISDNPVIVLSAAPG